MSYYILQKPIHNMIELQITCPPSAVIHWIFTLYTSEINAFKELGVDIIPRGLVVDNRRDISISCSNKEITNKAVELLDSLITTWILGGEKRFG